MNTKEQKTIEDLFELIKQLKIQNENLNLKFQNLEKQVEQNHLPLNLEKQIEHSLNDVLIESFKKSLTGYNSPLDKYANNIISKYQNSIESTFDKIVSEGINTNEFQIVCKEELLKKIAKTIISGIDGSVDKVINQIKQDSVFRSKLTLFVNNLVSEFIDKK